MRRCKHLLDSATCRPIGWSDALSVGMTIEPEAPAEIDRVILNLVLNERDTMPDGGRASGHATVRTWDGECEPISGCPSWTQLTFDHDRQRPCDGSDILAKVFVPFVTTKKVCEDVGLGHAMAPGLVKPAGTHRS